MSFTPTNVVEMVKGKQIGNTTLPDTIISDAYDNAKTYTVGDYCIYGNILYKCNTAITTPEDFDSTKWDATTIGDEFVGINADLSELNSNKQDKADNSLATVAKTVVGAINELNTHSLVTGFYVSSPLTIIKKKFESIFLCWGAYTAKSVCFIPAGSSVIEKIITSTDAPITISSDMTTITLTNPNSGNVGTLRGFYIKY